MEFNEQGGGSKFVNEQTLKTVTVTNSASVTIS